MFFITTSIAVIVSSFCLVKLFSRKKYDWRGKTVLITGGGGGLGMEFAAHLYSLGANIILWDIRFEYENSNYAQFIVDLTDEKKIRELAEGLRSNGDNIDVLINNAGLVHGRELFKADTEFVSKLLRVNLESQIWTIKYLRPNHIVSIASVMGLFGAARLGPYCASKAGLILLMDCLRLELDIPVTTICPYHIATKMFDKLKTPWLTRLILPTLTPEYVVRRTILAIERKERMVVIPRILWYIYLLRGLLPVSWFDQFCILCGAIKSTSQMAKN